MQTNRPRVSLGMPVFNGQKYLALTLDSILAQTYSDFEVVVSDNCSTDGTQQLCESYAARDGRIKYHRNPRNIGIAPNFNRAFELSSGEYFKWTDHDDLLAPEFVARCVEGLDQYPDAAVCFPKTRLIDENGGFIKDFEPPQDASSLEPHVRFKSLVLDPDHVVSQASGIMRADLIRRTVMHRSYPCSDEVFLAHLSLLGSFRGIPDRLFFYRIHPKQSTKGVLASERSRVKFFDTSLDGQVVLIKWLYFKDCLFAIRTSPISALQKLFCYSYMLRWLLVLKNFKSITKDLLLAIHERIPLFPKLYQEALRDAGKSHHYQ